MLASVTLAATAASTASATTAEALFPDSLALRLPVNAAQPAEQNDSFPKSQQHAGLTSVACPSAGDCVAAGDYTVDDRNADQKAMVATETNGAWNAGVEVDVSLNDLTCPRAGACVGVGGDEVVAQTRGVWGAPRKIRLPANALIKGSQRDASLSSVACTSVGACVAVGGYEDTSRRMLTMVVTESGGVWGVAHAIALPANAPTMTDRQRASLHSVACTAVGSCVAVGNYEDANGASDQQAMLATETSGAWGSGVELALPTNASTAAGKQRASLVSVTCTAIGNCVAVGSYDDAELGGDQEAMIATETSAVWGTAVALTGLPENAATGAKKRYSALASVACIDSASCAAVGYYAAKNEDGEGEAEAGVPEAQVTQEEPMAVTETGGAWAPATATALPGGGFSDSEFNLLSSVACTNGSGSGACVAVGTYLNDCAPEIDTCADDGSGAMVLGQHLRQARLSHRRA